MRALIMSGSNNMYIGRLEDGTFLECRIKGKVLKGAEREYNPIAPGDWVSLEQEDSASGTAMILERSERKNFFSRWNQKGRSSQVLAANLDIVLCLSCSVQPPFRPRFLDRVLLQADRAKIPALIVHNKCDLPCGDPDDLERLEDFKRLGWEVYCVSAVTGEGLDALAARLDGSCAALVGQSGVGKSSILNALDASLEVKTAELSKKFNRGTHTTTMGRLYLMNRGNHSFKLIDTPGIRRFVPDDISPSSLGLYMREFSPLLGSCTFGMSCSHRSEPGCKILEAVNAGFIHEDRYESFFNILEDLDGIKPYWEQD